MLRKGTLLYMGIDEEVIHIYLDFVICNRTLTVRESYCRM